MRSILLPLVLLLPFLGAPSYAAPKAPVDPQIQRAVRDYDVLPSYKGPNYLRVYKVLVSGPYALAYWVDGPGGGQAILKKSANGWKVLKSAGGKMDLSALLKYGVPASYAKSLDAKNQ